MVYLKNKEIMLADCAGYKSNFHTVPYIWGNSGQKEGAFMENRTIGRFGIRDIVLHEICRMAEKNRLERVILFGSRARGDFSRASDIDLAVLGGDIVNFALDVEEDTQTLLEFDVIDLSKLSRGGFAETIQKEGVVLYEKI